MKFKLPEYHAPDFSREPFLSAPDVRLDGAPADGVAPDYFHSTSMYPEYFKIRGEWRLAEDSRMDCPVVLREGGALEVVEARRLKKGDMVILGRSEDAQEGIYLHASGFSQSEGIDDRFVFRSGRSRETAYSMDYDFLYELLFHERTYGKVLWVLGPAVAFDSDSRHAMQRLVENGFVGGLLAGNALATHDLEGGLLKTALGQDIYTQESKPNGHYNHLDLLNLARKHGSIKALIANEGIKDGIIYGCVKSRVPFVLAGSIRDDGPLPETVASVYEAQDKMRELVRGATCVICLATTLHTIATGNMTPSFRVVNGVVRPLYIYTVDISEFAVNKLHDRGSLSARSIVTNAQDFVVNCAKGVGVY